MEQQAEIFPALRCSGGRLLQGNEAVVREAPVTIIFNNRELATLLCSPFDLDYLAVGFLFSERLIERKDQIKKILVDDVRGTVRVDTVEGSEPVRDVLYKRLITSGCGSGVSLYRTADAGIDRVKSDVQLSSGTITNIIRGFKRRSETYARTHGMHNAALYNGEESVLFCEDIGRHNAIDKIIGRCLWEGIEVRDRVIAMSGRVSSEILYKIAKAGIPVIISIAAPTSLGVKIADEMGITLIASARGKAFSVYTHGERLITE